MGVTAGIWRLLADQWAPGVQSSLCHNCPFSFSVCGQNHLAMFPPGLLPGCSALLPRSLRVLVSCPCQASSASPASPQAHRDSEPHLTRPGPGLVEQYVNSLLFKSATVVAASTPPTPPTRITAASSNFLGIHVQLKITSRRLGLCYLRLQHPSSPKAPSQNAFAHRSKSVTASRQ